MANMKDRHNFNLLIAALSDVFREEGRDGGLAASIALREAQSKPYRRTVSTADPGLVLESACRLSRALPLASLVMACRQILDWTTWEGRGLEADLSAKLFTTELVGPDGHIAVDDVRVGLLVSASDTDYPISSHSGEETYFVISGLAEWAVGDQPHVPKTPGSFVHHPSWVPHGRKTRNEPFLGAWRWSGDLNLSTFSVVDTP